MPAKGVTEPPVPASTEYDTKNPAETTFEDADLRAVVDAWPTLPDAVRAGIVAMVRAAVEADSSTSRD